MFSPASSHTLFTSRLMVQAGYSSSEHHRKQILGFWGKPGCAWAVLEGKQQVDKADHLRGFSVFISMTPRRKPLMGEASRAAIA